MEYSMSRLSELKYLQKAGEAIARVRHYLDTGRNAFLAFHTRSVLSVRSRWPYPADCRPSDPVIGSLGFRERFGVAR